MLKSSDCPSIGCELIDDLVKCTDHEFPIYVDNAISYARYNHKKIPYYEISEAIRKRLNGLSNKKLVNFVIGNY